MLGNLSKLTQIVNGKKEGEKARNLYPISLFLLHIPALKSGQWRNLVLNSELKPSAVLLFLDLGYA